MTTPTTPYALFRFVPLSECRGLWKQTVIDPLQYGDDDYRNYLLWRDEIKLLNSQRALAAVSHQLKLVTAERDALRRELDAP